MLQFDRLPSGGLPPSSGTCALLGRRAPVGLLGADIFSCTGRAPLDLLGLGTVISRDVDPRYRRPAAAAVTLKVLQYVLY